MNDNPDLQVRRWRWIYIGAILLVSLPYAISFTSQLISDDFILLYYYGDTPLWNLWGFFNPKTIWTYHPLQHYYYGIGWHLSGIEPWSYRAMSLGLHLATTLLLMKFARDLTGSIHVGGFTALAFATHWRHFLTITWAASIATVQSAFFTMLVCVFFLQYLQRRRRISYALMILAAMGWFFAKETFIQLPLFLAIIYLYHIWSEKYDPPVRRWKPRGAEQSVPPWLAIFGEMFLLLAIPAVLVVVYLVIYDSSVENTYTFAPLAYDQLRRPISDWGKNTLHHLDYGLDPLIGNQLLTYLPWKLANRVLVTGPGHVFSITALILVVYLAVERRMLPLFALAMMFVGMVPYFALTAGYAESRYHYASNLGAALLIVSLWREALRMTLDEEDRLPPTGFGRALQINVFREWSGWSSVIRVLIGVCAALWILVCIPQLVLSVIEDGRMNRPARELHDFFATQTEKAKSEVLFVMDLRPRNGDGAPVESPSATQMIRTELLGWGLLESCRLALGTDEARAVLLGFEVDPGPLAEFNEIVDKYWVRKGEKGWEADLLPDHYFLRPGSGRGVELAQRP